MPRPTARTRAHLALAGLLAALAAPVLLAPPPAPPANPWLGVIQRHVGRDLDRAPAADLVPLLAALRHLDPERATALRAEQARLGRAARHTDEDAAADPFERLCQN